MSLTASNKDWCAFLDPVGLQVLMVSSTCYQTFPCQHQSAIATRIAPNRIRLCKDQKMSGTQVFDWLEKRRRDSEPRLVDCLRRRLPAQAPDDVHRLIALYVLAVDWHWRYIATGIRHKEQVAAWIASEHEMAAIMRHSDWFDHRFFQGRVCEEGHPDVVLLMATDYRFRFPITPAAMISLCRRSADTTDKQQATLALVQRLVSLSAPTASSLSSFDPFEPTSSGYVSDQPHTLTNVAQKHGNRLLLDWLLVLRGTCSSTYTWTPFAAHRDVCNVCAWSGRFTRCADGSKLLPPQLQITQTKR